MGHGRKGLAGLVQLRLLLHPHLSKLKTMYLLEVSCQNHSHMGLSLRLAGMSDKTWGDRF